MNRHSLTAATLHELNIALSGIIYLMFDERGGHFNLMCVDNRS